MSDTTVWTKVDDECIAPAENIAGKEVYSSEYGKVEVTIPELGHTPSDEWTSDPAEHWHSCSGCTEKLDPSAHTEDGGAVTVQPTETTEGTKTFKCTVCGYVMRTETIPATGGSSGSSGGSVIPSRPSRPSRPSHTQTDNNGNVSKDVKPGANVPKTEIATPLDALSDIVLTPAEKAKVSESEPSESSEDVAPDDNNPAPSESSPSGDNSNPATGIAVTLFPLAIALAAMTVSAKRRR